MPIPSNDPLAAQLNDLAIANADGLLNDDEYRLLRQNLFERYAGGVEILSVTSPTTGKHVSAPRRKHVQVVEQPTIRAPAAPHVTPARSKISGVAGLFRRATGRSKSTPPAPSPPTPIKLNLIPRMFSKKPDDNSYDTDSSSVTRHSSSRSASRKGSSVGSSVDLPHLAQTRPKGLTSPASPTRRKADPTPPSSPLRANFDSAPRSPSRSAFSSTTQSKYDVIPGASNDIFDDDNLSTSEAIRRAIAAVEAEGRRLVAAFNDLETSAVIRYRREHPQRQRAGPSTAPYRPSLNPIPGPSSGSGGSSHTQTPNRSRSNSYRAETQSIRSNSSLRTTKSIASFLHSSSPSPAPPSAFSQSTPPQSTSPSTWTARLPSLRRKGSAASLASQSPPPPASGSSSSTLLSPGHPPGGAHAQSRPEQLVVDVAQYGAPPAPAVPRWHREREHHDGAPEFAPPAAGRGRRGACGGAPPARGDGRAVRGAP
ncbi:hypothetical protein MSAN_00367400 [Mycena sanguinolenta]|uniref:Uncharacterized protein n=1 Tax=Mycena sanguinolenta TaxID=230812 RepID=A0A8H7DKQ4_9AGAR|nr:hypothetical protein MSAN_00367400 [Mycena sanguinolenta]